MKLTLPGVSTVIKDRFYSLARTNIPVGPRVLAIAKRDTADGTEDAADLNPYNAVDESAVIDAFGEGSHLHRAYRELVSGGAQRVVLLPLPEDTEFNHSVATISSDNYGSTLWDDLWAAVEATQADIVVPWGRGGHPSVYGDEGATVTDEEIGFHADNSGTVANSWVQKIATKVADVTANSHPCFAVLGVKPWAGTTELPTPAQISSHLQLLDLPDHESVTSGPYVSVVVTEVRPVGYDTDFGYSNGACLYAADIASRDVASAPTGKSVIRVEKFRYQPTRSQQLNLVEKAVVSIAGDFNRQPKWTDAATFGKETSDYRRLTTLRIVFDAIQLVRQIAQPFVGEPASVQTKNALETAVTAGLRAMQIAGSLLASDFTITYLGNQNMAIIDLVLTPAFELRNIEVRISVQL